MMSQTIRTYSELITLPTFKERFDYLSLQGTVGLDTFGSHRYLNQRFYNSLEWKNLKRQIIIRDNGCDLGMDGYEIYGPILIHHLNPINMDDILSLSEFLLNPNYLVCTSLSAHNAIHYSDESFISLGSIERKPNDTCLWH